MNQKVSSGKIGERVAAEGTRTAERKKGRVLRQISRRGSQDTSDGPEKNEHASHEAQGVHGSKAHRSGSQDTSDGPE